MTLVAALTACEGALLEGPPATREPVAKPASQATDSPTLPPFPILPPPPLIWTSACGPALGLAKSIPSNASNSRTLAWLPDGGHIIFDDRSRIMRVDVQGNRLETLVEANPWNRTHGADVSRYGYYADLSADGSQLVYTSCEFETGLEDEQRYEEGNERVKYTYELVRMNLDGTGKVRLTTDPLQNHYPVWSPDMTRIAYLASDRRQGRPKRLRIMGIDGSDQTPAFVTEEYRNISGFRPPVWSPDGSTVLILKSHLNTYEVHAFDLDNGTFSDLGDTYAGLSWSPDGQRLALFHKDHRRSYLIGMSRDGTDRRIIGRLGGSFTQSGAHIDGISWSPDGRHLLYRCSGGFCVVDLRIL
ncbi:MAG: hypothetical protein OXN21_05805 [Chloroflexota bacterium]|nr:hypothetical protein [Chloroflexota bacterium]